MEAKNRVILSLTLLYHSLVRAGEYKIFIPWLLHLLSQKLFCPCSSLFSDYVDRSEGDGDVKIDGVLTDTFYNISNSD